MKNQKLPFLLCLFLLLVFIFTSAADNYVIKSPDGKLSFKLFKQNSKLGFSIQFLGATIIEPSPIIMLIDGNVITSDINFDLFDQISTLDVYPLLGNHNFANNESHLATVKVKQGKYVYAIEVCVSNDGAAFRLLIPPGKDSGSISHIPDEQTVFHLPAKSILWYHDLNMHYESVHEKNEIEKIENGVWLAPPATFKIPGGYYASITEANLLGYPGMALQANGKNGLVMRLPQDQPTNYPYRLRYSPEDTARLKKPAAIKGAINTPWRVIIVGKDLNALVNSDIVTHLNPPPDSSLFPKQVKTNWIKPGRAVWKYLNGGGDGTLEVMKHFTDGAAALGFEHNILEGFWSRWPEAQLRELVEYSKQKGVGIWLWKHSKSLRNPASRDSFFRKCNELGIAGAKIDFFDHEAKEVIDLYEDIFKESAKYHVMLDFHGANKPTGLMRTYPNSMTYEAVKGMEASKITDRATHETTIPFTRLLAGPAEYTVMHFGERRKNTTWAHQVASAAILSAPLLTYAANPDTILMNPAVDIIKAIPATWDETIVLPSSEIGELAVFARRKGNDWFIAIMNGVGARKIKIPLTFLKGDYTAIIAKDDGANSANVLIEKKNLSGKDVLDLELASGGGYIGWFRK